MVLRASTWAVGLARIIALLVVVLFVGCAAKGGDNAASNQHSSDATDATDATDAMDSAVAPDDSASGTTLQVGITRGSSKPRLLGTMAYDCDDGANVVAQLDSKTGGLWVFLPEETVLLPHVPSASGTHYSNGRVSLWSKGNQATVEVNGVLRQCVEDRRRSIIEDSKLRGNDFWATGNEPGWKLEIGYEYTVLRTDYGQVIYTLRSVAPQVDAVTYQVVYDCEVDGVAVRIAIEGTPCSDSMADTTYESKVTITLDGQTLHGCGMALH